MNIWGGLKCIYEEHVCICGFTWIHMVLVVLERELRRV